MMYKFQKQMQILTAIACVFLALPLLANNAKSNSENAKWIWQEEAGPANTWVAFRKTITLDEVPVEALTKISVDTKYWLWINGEMVLFEGGLARGHAPNTIYYDPVDFVPYLKKGKNTIAILVWYWGRTRKVHEDSGKGGLCVVADWSKELNTDNTWKMSVHPAYDPLSGGGGPSANRVQAYNVKFDARKAMGDWTADAWYSTNFNDSKWSTPIEKGTVDSQPWGKWVERSIPQWNDRGLADYEKLNVKLPFVNTADSAIVIRAKLPFNKQVTPYLKVRSAAGKTIVADTDNPFNMLSSTYVTKDGVQEFEGYTWFNGHNILYKIPQGVEVLELKYRWTGLGDMPGTFECSDDYFTRLWWMARNTLYICARDCYMDCPDRERGLWIGDVADQTGAVFYTLDEPGRLLLKKGIDNTIAYRNGDTIQGLAPGFGDYRGKSSELTSQSLQYIEQGIWQYYFNTGDKATLEYAYPAVLNYLKLWSMMPNGLPEHRKGYANWVDWGADPDQTPTNVILYYMALKGAKNMAVTLNKKDDLDWYNVRIKSIEENFEKEYWLGTRYGSKDKPVEERVSALAIISGLAHKKHYDVLVDSTLLPVQKCSPHMEWMVEEAIMLTGQYDKGLLRMRQRHEFQVNDKNLTTMYERFPNDPRRNLGTPNHAWNAPNYVLSRYIAGIKATNVAWSEFEVKPNLAHLTHVKQIVPSVKGDIHLEVHKTATNYKLNLLSVPQTTATIYLPKAGKVIKEILLNNKTVWKKGKPKKSKFKDFSFESEDSEFLKFKAKAGNWKVEVVYK